MYDLKTTYLLFQIIAAQYITSYTPHPYVGSLPNIGCGHTNYNSPIVSGVLSAKTNAGSFTVTSTSPIAPSGVSVTSEYVIEGPLSVNGELPLLGAVGIDGYLPTGGEAGTFYACGSNVGMNSESLANAGVNAYSAGNVVGNLAAAGLSTSLTGANLANARLGHSYSCI